LRAPHLAARSIEVRRLEVVLQHRNDARHGRLHDVPRTRRRRDRTRHHQPRRHRFTHGWSLPASEQGASPVPAPQLAPRRESTALAPEARDDDNLRLSAMLRRQHRSPALVVGVDAGGTWIRLRAMSEAGGRVSLTQPVSAVPELATFLYSVWRR